MMKDCVQDKEIVDDFLREEIRSDFLVSVKRKKVWKVELELFEVFKEICKKHQLKYYLLAGSLLGAVRHGGFIPWDDDMDIGLPRADYNKFVQVAEECLEYPYVLETSDGKDDFYCGFSRIKHSQTAALIPGQWSPNVNRNHGIFLDIFPLDEVPDGKVKRFFHKNIGKILSVAANGWMFDLSQAHPKTAKETVIYVARKLLRVIPAPVVVKWRDRWISKYNGTNQKEIGWISMFYNMPRFMWERSDLLESIEVKYEYTTACIPKNYENVLKKTYGDWRKIVRGGSCHEGAFFDPDKSYTYYMEHYEEWKDYSEAL